jgi:hypothetical protein
VNLRGKIVVLLFFIAVCAAVPLVNYSFQFRHETVKPSDLYQVVYSQLDAFRASDYPRAYFQASYGIQQKFKPDQFIEMIRQNYAGIMQADRVEFGMVRCRDQHAFIQVFFIGRDGVVQPSIYSLIYEGKTWKIDGARMLQRWPAGSRLGGLRI